MEFFQRIMINYAIWLSFRHSRLFQLQCFNSAQKTLFLSLIGLITHSVKLEPKKYFRFFRLIDNNMCFYRTGFSSRVCFMILSEEPSKTHNHFLNTLVSLSALPVFLFSPFSISISITHLQISSTVSGFPSMSTTLQSIPSLVNYSGILRDVILFVDIFLNLMLAILFGSRSLGCICSISLASLAH